MTCNFMALSLKFQLPYFLGYKTSVFFLPKQSKKLDPSRSLGLLRKDKTGIIAKFQRTDLVICSHSRDGKTPHLIAV